MGEEIFSLGRASAHYRWDMVRLLTVALLIGLCPTGRAFADRPAVRLEGQLPFTADELQTALELRLPDAQALQESALSVHGEGSQSRCSNSAPVERRSNSARPAGPTRPGSWCWRCWI